MKNKWISILPLSLMLLQLPVSCGREEGTDSVLPIVRKALYDSASVYFGNFGEYPDKLSSLPLGIIDCSVDGFCVIEKFLGMDSFDNITGEKVPDSIGDFAGENFQIIADAANGPFIGYARHDNRDYQYERLVKDALFLMGGSHYNLSVDNFKSGIKEPVKLIVYASDFSDLEGTSVLNEFLNRTGTGVKAIGVLESGIRDMVDGFAGQDNVCVGILYPSGALSSREYESEVRTVAEKCGFNGILQIYNQEAVGLSDALREDTLYVLPSAKSVRNSYSGPVLGVSYNNIDVSLLDRYRFKMEDHALLLKRHNGAYTDMQLNSVENYVRYHLVSMVERHRRSGSRVPISAILLVDYRYEEVLDIMAQVISELYDYKRDGMYLYRNSLSRDFRFILPIESAAVAAYSILRTDGHLALSGTKSELRPFITWPSSGLNPEYTDSTGRLTDEFKYGRAAGTEDIYTKELPFAPRYVDAKTMMFIENNNPLTYSLIRNTLY